MTILQAPSKKLFEDLACLSCCTPLLDPFGQKYCLHCGGSVLVHQCACGRPVPHKPDGTLYNHCSSCGKSTKDVVEKRPKIRLVYNEGQDYKLTCPCLSREPLQEKRPDLNSQLFRQIGASTKKRKKATRPPDTDAEIADRLFGTGSMDFDHDESLNSDDTELAYTGDVLQLIPEKQPKLVSGVRIQPSNNSPSTKTSDGRDKPIPPGRQRQAGQVGGGNFRDEMPIPHWSHRNLTGPGSWPRSDQYVSHRMEYDRRSLPSIPKFELPPCPIDINIHSQQTTHNVKQSNNLPTSQATSQPNKQSNWELLSEMDSVKTQIVDPQDLTSKSDPETDITENRLARESDDDIAEISIINIKEDPNSAGETSQSQPQFPLESAGTSMNRSLDYMQRQERQFGSGRGLVNSQSQDHHFHDKYLNLDGEESTLASSRFLSPRSFINGAEQLQTIMRQGARCVKDACRELNKHPRSFSRYRYVYYLKIIKPALYEMMQSKFFSMSLRQVNDICKAQISEEELILARQQNLILF